MLRKASLLFLDEATSSLDSESESLVQTALDALIARGHCTILLVAHRSVAGTMEQGCNDFTAVVDDGAVAHSHPSLAFSLFLSLFPSLSLSSLLFSSLLFSLASLSTVMNADQICVLDGGRIVERGTHDQLVEKEGIYAKLVQRQLARKQNLIEEEEAATDAAAAATPGATAAAGGAAGGVPHPMSKLQREASEQAKKAKEKVLSAVDDFDSLFDEQKEQEQQQTAGGTSAAAPTPADAATTPASSSAAPRSQAQ